METCLFSECIALEIATAAEFAASNKLFPSSALFALQFNRFAKKKLEPSQIFKLLFFFQ